jgi:hypothetical protein
MNLSEKNIEELKRKRKWKQMSENNMNNKKYNDEEVEEGLLFYSVLFLFYFI